MTRFRPLLVVAAARLLVVTLPVVAATGALAQGAYPNRQITIVVAFSAGGSTDIVARLVAEEMRKTWGQPVIVDNRPGAGGNIGSALVAKARPDGYTLLMGSVGPLAINATLYEKMPYDNLKDFTPISLVVHVPNMLVVNPKAMPVNSFAEFVALVRANPGKYFFASTGTGTSSHLSGELLKTMAGVDVTHVPYKGAVALNDLLSGEQVHFMFATIPSVIELVRSGRLRALAVTSKERSAAVPDIPTVAEAGFPDFGVVVVRFARPRRAATRNRHQAAGGGRARAQDSRAARKARATRRRPRGQHTGGIRSLYARGDGQMGEGREGFGRQGGLTTQIRGAVSRRALLSCILITGAADGRGQRAARLLVAGGHRVVLPPRSGSGRSRSEDAGPAPRGVRADLGNPLAGVSPNPTFPTAKSRMERAHF